MDRKDQYKTVAAACAVLNILDDMECRASPQAKVVLQRVFGPAGDYAMAVWDNAYEQYICRHEV